MNIVVETLTTRLTIVVGKRKGAEDRLAHARKQIEIETGIIAEAEADIILIEDAILQAGGTLAMLEEGDEPYVDLEGVNGRLA